MSSKPIHVCLVHRAPGRLRSIEELFLTIASALPVSVAVDQSVAPQNRATVRALWTNLRWATTFRDCDVIHQTGDIHYAVLGVWRCPVVLTIHDLRFIEEARGLKRLLFGWLWLYLPCLRADRVTVISEFTKNRLLALCRVNPAKIRVIPNCVSADFVAQPKPWPVDGMVGRTGLGLPTYPPGGASDHAMTPDPQGEPRTSEAACPYPLQGQVRVLCVGTTENKNLSRVAEASEGLGVKLCILGKLTEQQRQDLELREVDYESHWGLPKEKVVELYQSCDLVCFVSTYEGFGMPILEGQAVGRPVLTSNISPMREVAGGGALTVDPFDVSAIRGGLKRLLEDAGLREDLVKEGVQNVAKYSAKSIAGQYAELYREVVEER